MRCLDLLSEHPPLLVSRERHDKTPWTQYGITLNGEYNLDVPEESRSTSSYCATLGHKCNHSFQGNARLVNAIMLSKFQATQGPFLNNLVYYNYPTLTV